MSTTDLPEDIQDIARSDIPSLRRTMKKLGVTVAEIDCDLRYVWIDNPHPDFDPAASVGMRDDELMSAAEAVETMGVKQAVLEQRKPISRILAFKRSDGWRHYSFRAFPVRNARGRIDGIVTLGFETSLHQSRTSRQSHREARCQPVTHDEYDDPTSPVYQHPVLTRRRRLIKHPLTTSLWRTPHNEGFVIPRNVLPPAARADLERACDEIEKQFMRARDRVRACPSFRKLGGSDRKTSRGDSV